jgi:hypothetical protein
VVTWSGCFPERIRHSIDYASLSSGLFIGFAYVPASPDWQQSARRLVDIPIWRLEKSLVVGKATGMMTPDKKGEGFLPGIEFQANHGYSSLFSQRGTH